MFLQRATRTHRMRDAHYVCCVYTMRICMRICIYVRSVYGIGNIKIVDGLLNYTLEPGRIRAHYYDMNRSFRIYARILCYFESSNSKLLKLISAIQEIERGSLSSLSHFLSLHPSLLSRGETCVKTDEKRRGYEISLCHY
jgi:hypothetical protein